MEKYFLNVKKLRCTELTLNAEYKRAKRLYRAGKLDKATFFEVAMERNHAHWRYRTAVASLRFRLRKAV